MAETIPAPSASTDLEKKISLGLETKRLLLQIELEVAGLDWKITDPLQMVPQLAGPAQHLMAGGGKRVRPMLTCLLGKALGIESEILRTCAVAAELVHTATLLHDDILDGATTRRGRITAHLKYDAHTAILSGDALLAKAIADIAALGDPIVLQRLAQTVRELVEGECLQADLMGKVHAEINSVLEIARRKTASLFAWSAWVPGHLSSVSHANHLFQFGNHLGLAFQILDDILDWESEESGKPRFKDLAEAKLNIVSVKLLSVSPEATKLTENSFKNLNAQGELSMQQATQLGLSLSSDPHYANSVDWARSEAKKNSDFALAHLRDLPQSVWRDLVEKLTVQLLDRMK